MMPIICMHQFQIRRPSFFMILRRFASSARVAMNVITVPMLDSNYGYILVDQKTQAAVCVDPVEPAKILKSANDAGVSLSAILTTHHHWYDHGGGNLEMMQHLPSGAKVYGFDDRVPALNAPVKNGDVFHAGSLHVTALHVPCHTTGSISYHVRTIDQNQNAPQEPGIVFTGDTLFLAGCGRFFEGVAQEMYHALYEVLGKLDPRTLVYCGHGAGLILPNLRFAALVEPDNAAVKEKLDWALSKGDTPLVPSTIAEEFTYNPFMRVHHASVRKFLGNVNLGVIEAMDLLRKAKNEFK